MTKDDAVDMAALTALVDVLIPGDELFPCGSAIGVPALLAERLRQSEGEAVLHQVAAAIRASGGPLQALEPEARDAAVSRLEQAHPALFELVVKTAYLSYYENTVVHDAIRSLGFSYNTVPLPAGYEVGAFDHARDAPRHGRGRYVPTDEVRRVDLSKLDFVGRPA